MPMSCTFQLMSRPRSGERVVIAACTEGMTVSAVSLSHLRKIFSGDLLDSRGSADASRSRGSADASGKAGGPRDGEPGDVTPQEREGDGGKVDGLGVDDP